MVTPTRFYAKLLRILLRRSSAARPSEDHQAVLGRADLQTAADCPSTYYEVIAKHADVGRLSPAARCDMAMKFEIRRVFNENFQVYGVRNV